MSRGKAGRGNQGSIRRQSGYESLVEPVRAPAPEMNVSLMMQGVCQYIGGQGQGLLGGELA